MKATLIIIAQLILFSIKTKAQSSQCIPYQAVLRDVNGQFIANAQESIQMSLLSGGVGGSLIYQEEHEVITDEYGLIKINVGCGQNTFGIWDNIDWSLDNIAFTLSRLNQGSWQLIGSQSLQSVPFALHAEDIAMRVSLQGDTLWVGKSYSIVPGVSAANLPENIVFDFDGNAYSSVVIGQQEWMTTNLHVLHYRNGDPIPTGLTDAAWGSTTSGAVAVYNNIDSNLDTYGGLYNWYAVTDTRGLCPTGWHVPSDAEWTNLMAFADPSTNTTCGSCFQSSLAGGPLKSAFQWNSPNTGATDLYGLSLTGGGDKVSSGGYLNQGNQGYYWSATASSSTNAWYRRFSYNNTNVGRLNDSKLDGFSVRCLKD